jgi:hypothetical protein
MKQRLSQSFGGAAALLFDFAFTNRLNGWILPLLSYKERSAAGGSIGKYSLGGQSRL